MSTDSATVREHLIDRMPTLTGAEIVEQLVPPRQFTDASLETYRPDHDYPSQAEAVDAVRAFTAAWRPSGGFFSRRKAPDALPGLYLDGGFGVGKTHLLASLWHAAPGRKYFGTFIEYTALVGALGYAAAFELLKGASLLCIDEFELDDPGDTRIMSRLLTELVAKGSRIAATSNTPPNALGEGRFAAQDFLREIDALSAQFRTLRIDGLDYRRRDFEATQSPTTPPNSLPQSTTSADRSLSTASTTCCCTSPRSTRRGTSSSSPGSTLWRSRTCTF